MGFCINLENNRIGNRVNAMIRNAALSEKNEESACLPLPNNPGQFVVLKNSSDMCSTFVV